jgi:hypothetical protein
MLPQGGVANFVVGVIITFFLTIFILFSSELGHSPQLAPPPLPVRSLRDDWAQQDTLNLLEAWFR